MIRTITGPAALLTAAITLLLLATQAAQGWIAVTTLATLALGVTWMLGSPRPGRGTTSKARKAMLVAASVIVGTPIVMLAIGLALTA